MINRFTTPEIIANETGKDPHGIRDAIGCAHVGSIVWITDSGKARHIPRLSRLFSELLDMIEADRAEEEADYRAARYSALSTIAVMEEDGVHEEYIESFREILAKIERGEA